MTKVVLPVGAESPVYIEILNPSVKGTVGAAKAFVFAWWAGALTTLFDKEFDVKSVVYNVEKNTLTGQIVLR